jgi:hypothetical protein
MARSSLLFMFFLFTKLLLAQEYKRNMNWMLGFNPGVQISFNNNLKIDTLKNGPTYYPGKPNNCLYFYTPGCISDTFGNLLISGSGFALMNKHGFILSNSKYINCPLGKK